MGREILICREITKLYEENIRNLVDNLKEFETELKGEITVIISNEKIKKKSLTESDKQKIKKLLKKISIKDITKIISDVSF